MIKIGEDRSERLDVTPAQFRVIVTIRPRYACPKGRAGVTQAPARLIEAGLPTEDDRPGVPRDNQGDTAYCLAYECSRRCVSLPHLIVPLPHVTEC